MYFSLITIQGLSALKGGHELLECSPTHTHTHTFASLDMCLGWYVCFSFPSLCHVMRVRVHTHYSISNFSMLGLL